MQQQTSKWETSTDVTSIPASSPPRSPHLQPRTSAASAASDRPNKPRQNPHSVYYVQSPSQFDGDSLYNKSSLSLQSSPTASPSHHLDDSSRRHGKLHHPPPAGKTPWSTTCSVIDEEDKGLHSQGNSYQHPADRLSARIRLCIFFLVLFGALLGFLILLIWVITKPSAPQVSIKNVVFHDVYIGLGTDASGVPTNLITVNCTLQINFNNTSNYLKAHLYPLQAELLYSKLSITIGKVDDYAQSRKSHRVIPIQINAAKVALYGASSDLPYTQDSINQGFDLPLLITTSIQTRYYVVSKMVTSTFWTQITCNVDVNTKSLALIFPIQSSCT